MTQINSELGFYNQEPLEQNELMDLEEAAQLNQAIEAILYFSRKYIKDQTLLRIIEVAMIVLRTAI